MPARSHAHAHAHAHAPCPCPCSECSECGFGGAREELLHGPSLMSRVALSTTSSGVQDGGWALIVPPRRRGTLAADPLVPAPL